MTAAQWQTLGVIITILVSIATVYYLAKSQTREAQRQATEARDKAVKDATDPLNVTIERLRRVIDARDERITSLEDELRRGNRR